MFGRFIWSFFRKIKFNTSKKCFFETNIFLKAVKCVFFTPRKVSIRVKKPF